MYSTFPTIQKPCGNGHHPDTPIPISLHPGLGSIPGHRPLAIFTKPASTAFFTADERLEELTLRKILLRHGLWHSGTMLKGLASKI
jgi:hypothetical protein